MNVTNCKATSCPDVHAREQMKSNAKNQISHRLSAGLGWHSRSNACMHARTSRIVIFQARSRVPRDRRQKLARSLLACTSHIGSELASICNTYRCVFACCL
mmetsp:Transcript_37256/g.68727  ORF Transcript_37256/g.68727 Transcript_37256/m.68727 type:complete len:101 (+) Transcript_37256:566-868(+)